MRSHRHRDAAAASIAAALVLMGCSPGSHAPAAAPSSQPAVAPTGSAAETPSTPPAPPVIGVSPGGVTTAVEAPADSTELEYFQACHAARLWMAGRPGDPHAQIEPYLAMVQASANPGPGTFNSPWSQLAPARQSAVIVAVQAAADALCG
jgi:hypothetical protein